MKVTVFGAGYLGLVQAVVFAEVGHDVFCVDVNNEKIKNLKKGIIPIYEFGLEMLLKSNLKAKRLKFSNNLEAGIEHSVMQIISVGTPSTKIGTADLQYVISVVSTIAEYMQDYKVIINKSTAPVGTADKIRVIMKKILEKRIININFDIVSNPEFLKEGKAVHDSMYPERMVFGIDNTRMVNLLYELYEPFDYHHNRMIFMDVRSAELTKYAANCFLAAKISFINEISNLAERLGADIEKVRKGMCSDSRIGYRFTHPGCGYGGSCFSKDLQSLICTAETVGYEPHLLRAIEKVNDNQKNKLPNFIKQYFGKKLIGKTFAIWGLAFKADTNDMRNAPSCTIMERLWEAGAILQVFDPKAMDEAQRIYGNRYDLKLVCSKEAALDGADALIICTEWKNFRVPNFNLIKNVLKYPVIFDGRNLYDPEYVKQKGFLYYAIGRGVSVNIV